MLKLCKYPLRHCQHAEVLVGAGSNARTAVAGLGPLMRASSSRDCRAADTIADVAGRHARVHLVQLAVAQRDNCAKDNSSLCFQERNIELMRRQAELESQVFEAKSREARANALHLQLEGQVATEKANVHFLNGQLESQLGTLRADRDSASAQVIQSDYWLCQAWPSQNGLPNGLTLFLIEWHLVQAAQVSQQLTESQDELRSTKQLHASLRARVDQYAKKIQVNLQQRICLHVARSHLSACCTQ